MITPLDIQNKEFSRAVRGYNQEEVDLFLDEIMADYDKLLSENQGYAQFKAFNSKNVFGCNTATVNFYEETPFHPERLLRDIVSITHPKLNLGPPRYFHKLK